LRFADLLENLKSESGNCELMKSRILFIKKERECVCVCGLVQHLACEHGCWEGGDCGINPRVRVSPVRMACADLPSPSFANLSGYTFAALRLFADHKWPRGSIHQRPWSSMQLELARLSDTWCAWRTKLSCHDQPFF
jgi:hypothetical protein